MTGVMVVVFFFFLFFFALKHFVEKGGYMMELTC